jgi:hypothetical protein
MRMGMGERSLGEGIERGRDGTLREGDVLVDGR